MLAKQLTVKIKLLFVKAYFVMGRGCDSAAGGTRLRHRRSGANLQGVSQLPKHSVTQSKWVCFQIKDV